MNKGLQKVEKMLQVYSFKNDLGEEIRFTAGQKQIISAIINHGVEKDGKFFNRVQIETPTQYGKSCAIAAGLTMICTRKEKWSIVAGTTDKAQIIMDYFLDFAIDNQVPRALLRSDVPLDKLRMEKNKRNLDFASGFSVQVFSADSKNQKATGNAIMGFGSPFVLEDESCLIPDLIETKIVRMVGGYSTTKNLLIKIGNPFIRNHFLKTHNDQNYHLIWIDYKQAIEEGRMTESFINEMRDKPQFDVLYEVKFPPEGKQDDKGWMQLLTKSDIEKAFVDKANGFGSRRLGVDVASEGRNQSVIIQRYENMAEILVQSHNPDTMLLAESVITNSKYPYLAQHVFVDKVGAGKGCYDLLARNLTMVMGVNAGTEPFDKERFVNLRAEMFWKAREWILRGSKLIKDDAWFELTKIKYRTRLEGTKGKLAIMSKDDMLKEGVESPDIADALSLTFAIPDVAFTETRENTVESGFDKYALFNDL